MRSRTTLALLAPALWSLSACAVPVGPVEVSRFHLPDTAIQGLGTQGLGTLGHGSIAVTPGPSSSPSSSPSGNGGPGMDGANLEWQAYQIATERALSGIGYSPASPDTADQIAQLRIARSVLNDGVSAVRLGVAAAGDTHGSAAGVGISIPFGPRNSSRIATDLIVVIRDRASGKVLWEGRASFTVASTSPLAQSGLAAAKLADALFTGFPGQSGETIQVP